MWFTALYAVFVFWLLWGGSVWTPWRCFWLCRGLWRVPRRVWLVGPSVGAAVGIVVAAIWWLKVDTPFVSAMSSALDFGLTPVASDQFGGFLLAITIGVTAIGCSLPLGILLALGESRTC